MATASVRHAFASLCAALLFATGGPAQAAGPATPTATPNSIPAGKATNVTFVSKVAGQVIKDTIVLERLNTDGSVAAVLGNLRDDGKQGDAVAKDKNYTLRTSLNIATAGPVRFRVSAYYKNDSDDARASDDAVAADRIGAEARILKSSAPVTVTVTGGDMPVIGAAGLVPASATTGVATVSTVTAVIDNGTRVPTAVELQKVDASGQLLASLGPLNDAGTGGDAVAGDKVFSTRTTILENAAGTLRYRVAAAFDGVGWVYSSVMTATVTGVATGVAITSPANGTYLNTPVVTVSGTVGDPGATVSLNGIVTPVSNKQYTASVPLNEGPNSVTAVATNTNGTTSTASILVTLDTTPPRVEIYSPLAGASLKGNSITVTGLVNDIVVGTVNPLQATVKVNGVTAEVSNRSFTARNVPLVVGANSVQAVATDRAGNQNTRSISITRVANSQAGLGIQSGNNQSGPVGSNLAAPLVVELLNGSGQPVAGKPVVFRVIAQDGLVSTGGAGQTMALVNTNAQGRAQVSFKLGSRAGVGNNLVEATSAGVAATALFSASGTAGAAKLAVVDSGNGQIGVVGQPLPYPMIGIVVDAQHNRLPNVPVSFEVKAGGGSFAGSKTFQTTSDSDGRVAATLTLGPDQGIANNVVDLSFPGNPGFAATFTATGLVPGPADQTRISGVVLDNSNVPIAGVTVRLLQVTQAMRSNIPQEVAPAVRTDAQGQFVMFPVPVGVYKLLADGGTAERTGSYPILEYDIVTVSGQNNTVGLPLYLPELKPNNRLCVNETTGGTLTLAEAPGFALALAPGSATFPGGSKVGCVSVTTVNMDKVPMSPGFGQQPRFIVTIQPAGTHFNPPARMTMPNVDGLAPRAVTEMYSFDHDLGSFVAIGTATVSEDGATLTSDPGTGVIKAGWHCGGDPASSGSAGNCPDCQRCESIGCTADLGKNFSACESKGFQRNYKYNGISLLIDRSCMGECVNGTCGPSREGYWPDDIKKALNDAISKVFGSCVGTPLQGTMQTNLMARGVVVSCLGRSDRGTCAEASPGGNTIKLRPIGVAGGGCGTLASVMLHELVHTMGDRHGVPTDTAHNDGFVDRMDPAYGCENACYGRDIGTAAACK